MRISGQMSPECNRLSRFRLVHLSMFSFVIYHHFVITMTIHSEESSANLPEELTEGKRKPYVKPVLSQHGNVSDLTKSEYGGLDRLIYGSLFAMSSPGMPGSPNR